MSYNIDLSGRVAFVTGASSGLGAHFARTLSQAGAAVVLAARRTDRLKTLRAELEAAGGDAHVVALDVTDPDSIKSAVAHAETEMGTIDILVNNSGVSTTQKLVDVTPDDYDYVMGTNTRGAFFVAQEVARRMIARSRGAAPGTFTGGRIVTMKGNEAIENGTLLIEGDRIVAVGREADVAVPADGRTTISVFARARDAWGNEADSALLTVPVTP